MFQTTTLFKRVLFSIYQTSTLFKENYFQFLKNYSFQKSTLFNFSKTTLFKRVLLKRVLFLQKIVLLKRVLPTPDRQTSPCSHVPSHGPILLQSILTNRYGRDSK